MGGINVGIIGCGRIGITHIEAVRSLPGKANLYCVIDQNKALVEKVGKKYRTKIFYNITEAFKDGKIDAVVIGLPHFLHKPIAIQAMTAKKHVLCEKPLARDSREAEAMFKTAQENGVILMAGQSRRFFKALTKTRELVQNRKIGYPRTILYNFTCHFDQEKAPVWWREEDKVGGLVLPMLGSHSIDLCLWLFSDKKPISVYAVTSKRHSYFEGSDEGVVVVRFSDNSTATSYLSINNYPVKHQCQIIGTDGNIFLSHSGDHSGLIGTATTDLFLNGNKIMAGAQEPDNFTLQMKEFVEAIQEEREPSVRTEEMRRLISIIDLAKESSQENQVIKLSDK